MPLYWVSWLDAARFCNWLQNGQPTGSEGTATTETGAYTLNGDMSATGTEKRDPNAKYFIPSENEWYKAAYYESGGTNAGYWAYPTKSNTAPISSLALAGTSTNDANFYSNGYLDATNLLTPVGAFSDFARPVWHVRHGRRFVSVERGDYIQRISGCRVPISRIAWRGVHRGRGQSHAVLPRLRVCLRRGLRHRFPSCK